jgi:DNA repair protein RecN (Recombination protein N)
MAELLRSVRGPRQSEPVLRHLRVTNFAILSDVTIELGDGLAVLTGETGAGKSLIVEAVNLLRGGRASADIPRAGAAEATVEAIVEIPADLRARVRAVLTECRPAAVGRRCGRRRHAPEVVIRRVILRGGKSRTYVNGALTTAGRLAELGAWLVDLAGQHQHQGLVDRRATARSSTRSPTTPARARCRPRWQARREAMGRTLAAIDAQIALRSAGDDRQRAERADFVRFQKDELDAARLEAGEDERAGRRARAAVGDRGAARGRAAARPLALFGGDGDSGALDGLARAARELDRLVRLDAALDPVARQLAEARVRRRRRQPGRAALRRSHRGRPRAPGADRRSPRALAPAAAQARRRPRRGRAATPSWRPSSPRSPTATPTSRADRGAGAALARAERAGDRAHDSRRRAGVRARPARSAESLAELGMASARLELAHRAEPPLGPPWRRRGRAAAGRQQGRGG